MTEQPNPAFVDFFQVCLKMPIIPKRLQIVASGIKRCRLSTEAILQDSLAEKPIDEATLRKLDAFSIRAGTQFKNKHALLEALTHKSFKQPVQESPRFNLLGETALKFYTTEYVLHKYPKLPSEVVETIVDAYVGQTSLASVAKQFGVQFAMRWKLSEQADEPMPPPSTRSWIIKSLVGAIYSENGPMAAKQFIKTHIFPRAVDVDQHIDMYVKMKKPRVLLSYLTKSLNKPKPVAR